MNDAVIIFGICAFFLALGVLIPLVSDDFGGEAITATDTDEFRDDIEEAGENAGTITAWEIIKAVAGMFSWTFGTIWWPIDALILLPLRVVLYFVIARNIWIGGGA